MLVSAIGKFNTFNKYQSKSANSFGAVDCKPKNNPQKATVKTDLKTSFKACRYV